MYKTLETSTKAVLFISWSVCVNVFLNDDPIQHFFFLSFFLFFFWFLFIFVVLNCVTIQLDLLRQRYGHCVNSLCKNFQWHARKFLEGQIRTSCLEFEHAQCLTTRKTVSEFLKNRYEISILWGFFLFFFNHITWQNNGNQPLFDPCARRGDV